MQIAQGKRERGLISDNDLLQLKLNYLNASSSLIQTEQAYEQKMFALRNYLGYNERVGDYSRYAGRVSGSRGDV